jgi:hypothetical protein
MTCSPHSRFLGLAVLALAVTGCASVGPYRADYPHNLEFSSPGLKGGFLSSAKVSLNVFFADDACELTHQGSVALGPGDGPHQIGLPTDRAVYARILVETHSWLQNRTKTRSREFRFRPRKGYRYSVAYTHRQKSYGTRFTQTQVGSGQTSELSVGTWQDCRPRVAGLGPSRRGMPS